MVVPLSKDFELKVNPRVAAAVAAGLVVLGTAVLAIARVNGNSGWSQGGPLIVPNPHAYVVRHRVGDVFTDGLERIKLEGTQPGVLRRVEITGPGADHFKVLGVLLAGPHRRIEAWEVAPGFPPRIHGQGPTPLGRLVPAQGALLATGKVGSVLQIGLKVVRGGLGVRAGVRVYYTVGDAKYTAVLPAGIANCPAQMSTDQCLRIALQAARS